METKSPKSKKIVFCDNIDRHADLKIRLKHDGLTQAYFFRGLISGYLSKDENILNFIDKMKSSKKSPIKQDKKEIREVRELIKKGKEMKKSIVLEDGEIENIFDLLEQANPDL